MKRKDYIMHLIGEMSNFLLESEPTRMVLSLHQEEDGLHLAALDNTERSEKELEAIRNALNITSRPELAEYYGTMAGTDVIGSARLNLIGYQVKHADVNATAEGTKIDLWLGSDRFDSTHFNMPGKKK